MFNNDNISRFCCNDVAHMISFQLHPNCKMSSSATLLRSLSQCFTSASIKQPLRCIHRRFSQLRCSSAPRHQRTLAAIYRLESTVASMPEYEQENRIIRSNLPDMEIPEVPLAHYLLKCFDDYKDLKAMVRNVYAELRYWLLH